MLQGIYLSIINIEKYKGRFPFTMERHLVAAKENDDEKSIKVFDVGNTTVGDIADFRMLRSKAKSASEIYDLIGNYIVVCVVSSTPSSALCRIVDYDFKNVDLLEFFIEKDLIGKKFPYDEGYYDDDDPDDFPYGFDLVGVNQLHERFIPMEYLVGMLNYRRTTLASVLSAKKGVESDIGKFDTEENARSFSEHYNGYYTNETINIGYPDEIEILRSWFPLGEQIEESDYDTFISVYEGVIKKKRILSVFDEFIGNEILTPSEFQEYENLYFDSLKNRFSIKVNVFKRWLKTNYPEMTEYFDYGKWYFCDEFEEMISSALQLIEKYPTDKANEQIVDDLLYVLARDDECGFIIEALKKYGDWFLLLCRSSLKTDYRNAKLQFAEHIRYCQADDDLVNLIFDFIAAEDEGIEVLALQSLGVIDPEKAEKCAIDLWIESEYEDEYGFIDIGMLISLEALNQIHSPKLKDYLEIAKQSGNIFLEVYAEMISERGAMNG